MPSRDDRNQLVLHPRLGGESCADRRRADYAQLDSAPSDPLLNLTGVSDPQRERDAWVRGMKPSEDGGQQVRPGGGARTHRDRPHPQAAELDRSVLGARQEAERLAHEGLEEARRRGGPNAAPGALEQPHAEERFEAAHVLRDCRLAQTTRLRRASHTAAVEHRQEQVEAMKGDAWFSHRLLSM
jgi:hypothetical protein